MKVDIAFTMHADGKIRVWQRCGKRLAAPSNIVVCREIDVAFKLGSFIIKALIDTLFDVSFAA
jgi:hypothetical protein